MRLRLLLSFLVGAVFFTVLPIYAPFILLQTTDMPRFLLGLGAGVVAGAVLALINGSAQGLLLVLACAFVGASIYVFAYFVPMFSEGGGGLVVCGAFGSIVRPRLLGPPSGRGRGTGGVGQLITGSAGASGPPERSGAHARSGCSGSASSAATTSCGGCGGRRRSDSGTAERSRPRSAALVRGHHPWGHHVVREHLGDQRGGLRRHRRRQYRARRGKCLAGLGLRGDLRHGGDVVGRLGNLLAGSGKTQFREYQRHIPPSGLELAGARDCGGGSVSKFSYCSCGAAWRNLCHHVDLSGAESGLAILLHHCIGELLGRYERGAKERTSENSVPANFAERAFHALR